MEMNTMLVIFRMERCRGMGCGETNKVINTQVNGKATKLMAMAYTSQKLVIIKVFQP